jgi:hypothetical protein
MRARLQAEPFNFRFLTVAARLNRSKLNGTVNEAHFFNKVTSLNISANALNIIDAVSNTKQSHYLQYQE